MRNDFNPRYIKQANAKLDRYISKVNIHNNINKNYKKGVFRTTLWEKFLGLFIRKKNVL